MEEEQLVKKFIANFEKVKRELHLKTTYEDLDTIFFISDMVKKDGYLTSSITRVICHRIMSQFMSWNGYLHGLVMPNPNYMISVSESENFDEESKQELLNLMTKVMTFSSRNNSLTFLRDPRADAKFIDDAVAFWKNTFAPETAKYLAKIEKSWARKALEHEE